jgi:hypothetical protein
LLLVGVSGLESITAPRPDSPRLFLTTCQCCWNSCGKWKGTEEELSTAHWVVGA